MKTCPHCGSEFPDESSICPQCAKEASEPEEEDDDDENWVPPGLRRRPWALKLAYLLAPGSVAFYLLLPSPFPECHKVPSPFLSPIAWLNPAVSILAIILGLIGLVSIYRNSQQLRGKFGAYIIILWGGFWIGFFFLIFPALYKFPIDFQHEAKTNLGAIFDVEASYYGQHQEYAASFSELPWEPKRGFRYSYFLPGDSIQSTRCGPYHLPPGFKPAVSATGFTAVAVGNMDRDETLDVWIINDKKMLSNPSNDVME